MRVWIVIWSASVGGQDVGCECVCVCACVCVFVWTWLTPSTHYGRPLCPSAPGPSEYEGGGEAGACGVCVFCNVKERQRTVSQLCGGTVIEAQSGCAPGHAREWWLAPEEGGTLLSGVAVRVNECVC